MLNIKAAGPTAVQAALRCPATTAPKQATATVTNTGPYGYPAPRYTAVVAAVPNTTGTGRRTRHSNCPQASTSSTRAKTSSAARNRSFSSRRKGTETRCFNFFSTSSARLKTFFGWSSSGSWAGDVGTASTATAKRERTAARRLRGMALTPWLRVMPDGRPHP